MNASELRIGNYVEIDQYGNTRNVIRIDNGSEIDQVMKLRPSPIELTPEILEKCGFYYRPCGISGADMWQGMGFWGRNKNEPNQDFYLRGDFSRKRPISLKLSGHINSNIKYLHQLMNLYFALTGEELNFKP